MPASVPEQVCVWAGPMFEKTPLRPHTKLLPNTWLLQPVPQTYVGTVVGHRPRGGTLLFRVVDTTDSVGYVVDEDRLRGALKTDRDWSRRTSCGRTNSLSCDAQAA